MLYMCFGLNPGVNQVKRLWPQFKNKRPDWSFSGIVCFGN